MGVTETDIPHADLDDVAEDGVYFADGDTDLGIDVRKYASYVRELGLKPGEVLPDELIELCRTDVT